MDRPGRARPRRRPLLLITVAILGFLAALDPLRPVVFVLVLRTTLANAIAFLAGWAVALSLLFVVVFLAFGGDESEPSSQQRTWASILELVLGIVLLILALRRWRHRHDANATHVTPDAILRRIDRLTPRRAGFMGVLVQPRTLTAAAALVVARDRSGVLSLVIGFAVFAVVSTAALLAILAYDLWRPQNADHHLQQLVVRIEQQGTALFTLLCALAGGTLVVDAVRSLVMA